MKIEANIEMKFNNIQTLKALFYSIEPDNINFPPRINFIMKKIEKELFMKIESDVFNMTLISTIDDILDSVQISLNTLKKLEKD